MPQEKKMRRVPEKNPGAFWLFPPNSWRHAMFLSIYPERLCRFPPADLYSGLMHVQSNVSVAISILVHDAGMWWFRRLGHVGCMVINRTGYLPCLLHQLAWPNKISIKLIKYCLRSEFPLLHEFIIWKRKLKTGKTPENGGDANWATAISGWAGTRGKKKHSSGMQKKKKQKWICHGCWRMLPWMLYL